MTFRGPELAADAKAIRANQPRYRQIPVLGYEQARCVRQAGQVPRVFVNESQLFARPLSLAGFVLSAESIVGLPC